MFNTELSCCLLITSMKQMDLDKAETTTMHPKEKYSIPNLRNACRVLKRLSDFPNGMDVGSISQDLSIPRTTTLRICTSLELENLLMRNGSGKYVLGSGLAPLGMRALPNASLRTMSVPILSDLVGKTGETAHLAVLCGKQSLLLEVCDSPHPLRVASRPGSLALIHCSATGKIFLAYAVYVALEKFLDGVTLEERTPNTLTTMQELKAEIATVRAQGYAVDNEEYLLGVRCVAAPVRDVSNHVIAAVGITGAAARFSEKNIKARAKDVLQAADRLTVMLKETEFTATPHDQPIPTGSR